MIAKGLLIGSGRNLLSEFEYVNTTNVDFAEHKMSSLFAGHRLILNKQSDFSVRYAGVPIDEDTSINFFSYGSDVEVHPDPIKEFYLVQIPLKGVGVLHNREGEIDIRPGVLGVQNPDAIEKNAWQSGCERIVLRISRKTLEQHASQLMQEHLSSKLLFDSRVSLKDPAAYSWFSQIKTVIELIDNSADINQIQSLLKVYASNIKTAVLLSLPNNYSESIKGRTKPPLPHYIKKATDYIHFNYESSVQLEDLANHTGYSVRSLVEGFRKFVGTSPKKYLTEIRLSAARQKLLDPNCGESVTEIAFMAGFTQLGRFSGLYKERFGELPSQTRSSRNTSWQPPRLLSS